PSMARPRILQPHEGWRISVSLTLEQVKERARRAPMVPIFRDMLADALTPVTAFASIGREGPAFLLESVEGGERLGRYSFVAADPMAIVTITAGQATVRDGEGERGLPGADPWKALETYLQTFKADPAEGLPEGFCGGAVGYFAYEAARYLERLPIPDADPLQVPDGVFIVTDTLACFDHVRHRLKLVSHVRTQDGPIDERYDEAVARIDDLARRLLRPVALRPLEPADRPTVGEPRGSMSQQAFFDAVEQAKAHILAGDIYQVQIAQRYTAPQQGDPFDVYRLLRALNPSPYMYFLRLPQVTILGTSPEILVTVQGRNLRYRPIAGTRRRGRDAQADQRMEDELRSSEKERAEHVMLVDLGRNDLGRVCDIGSVKVTELMIVERYSHVMHLVSNIRGRLRADCTPMDALRACFPAGTVTGAPKIRAMEIIADLEHERRGVYAGAIGYLSFTGDLDTCIAIRTMVVKDGCATVQAAAGIVADSVPAEEFLEARNKASALLQALEGAR
ncbi:MAG TPA: anthranilate synthase component I, partial [Candidatus Acidoferrum sp.]|nr:anthranilate synthase component I [Candidatus Acidoferrum sp.]